MVGPGCGLRQILLLLSTATLSILSYEHTCNEPVIRLWNDDRHVGD